MAFFIHFIHKSLWASQLVLHISQGKKMKLDVFAGWFTQATNIDT